MLAPIQAAFAASPEWQDITAKAYPPEEKKKEKKVKNKGTRYPGGGAPPAAGGEALPVRLADGVAPTDKPAA